MLRGKDAVRIFLCGELIVELTYGGAPVVGGEGVLRPVEVEAVVPFTHSGEVVVGVLGIGAVAVCVVVGIGIGICIVVVAVVDVVAVGLVCIMMLTLSL